MLSNPLSGEASITLYMCLSDIQFNSLFIFFKCLVCFEFVTVALELDMEMSAGDVDTRNINVVF